MGLDGVEIVLKVEETFGIAIDDSEAAKVLTPGQLIDLVMSKVGHSLTHGCLTQRAFHRVRSVLMRRFRLRRDQIRPDTLLKDVFPRSTRKEDVATASQELLLSQENPLARPSWLTGLLLFLTVGGGISFAVWIWSLPMVAPNPLLHLVLLPMPLIGAALFVAVFGWLVVKATTPTQVEFTPSIATVGNLSRWIVTNSQESGGLKPNLWNRQQVAEVVRQIVMDQLGCESEYREDAHFVYDLGMD